ncbi:MAG TPA: tetratricopeptide repeat protein [Pyrinomonadaceae bacterium]|jgi:tetratricopeptide (TPR) repeat protein|nr:tetratricopeptide repeat protein [Pyrinomonadaceae bacterium]
MPVANKKSAPLEHKRRLSRSVLWKLQRNYFDRQGIEAWSTGAVPHHITSSPFIADSYARVVFGFLRDCRFAEGGGDQTSVALDLSQPVHVVELGSGPGRFAYLFLKKFLGLLRGSALNELRVRYLMTDFAERNLEYWRAHAWLRPFVEDGSLDFALFDAERNDELTPVISGEPLSAGSLCNPLVVVSNYFFDSLPQDAFAVAGGQLFETLVTVSTAQKETDREDPEILSRAEVSYQNSPAEGDYYEDPAWNRLLEDYRRRLPAASFLFPTAALKCVEYFQRLSGGRMLMLSGDRGYHGDDAILRGQGTPTMAVHGSFSMMVDYQIVGEHCRHLGGRVIHPSHRHESLNVSALLFGDSRDGFAETRQAYAEAVEKFGPDDFFTLKEGVAGVYDSLSPAQLLAFLRLSGWDYKRFLECLHVFKSHLPELDESQKQELHEAVRRIWDAYLPIGEQEDLAFHVGTLLLEMEFYGEALEFLQHSLDLYGAEPGTLYNMAVCCHGLRQTAKAVEHVERALELDAEFDAAKALRIELQTSAAR